MYIKGVSGRGDEVIKALKNLGAKDGLFINSGSNDNFIYFIDHKGEIDYEYLDTEPAQIIMDNYREIKLPEWKDGDILIKNDGTCYKIFSEYVSHDITSFYAYSISISINGTISKASDGIVVCNIKNYRLTTSEEKVNFHKLLHKYGKEWNAKKKQLVDWKWKPKVGESYFFIDSLGDIHKGMISSYGNKKLFDSGNYFQTKEEAEAMTKKIKKLLKENHEKTKENP